MIAAAMTWTRAGLWLIGAGSFVTIVAAISASPRAAVGGLSFSGPFTGRRERLGFALDAAGLLHVAVGSVIVAVTEFPRWWFVGTIAGTLTLVAWLLAAWKQWQYRVDHQRRALGSANNPAEQQLRQATLARCATWRWCLRHPFDDDPWPRSARRAVGYLPDD